MPDHESANSFPNRVDMTAQFDVLKRRDRTASDILVELTPDMYQPAAVPEHHWLYFTFRGFLQLRRLLAARGQQRIMSFCDIGTSSGLDALGAWEVFGPRVLCLTDILDEVLETAKRNVLLNARGHLRPQDLLTISGDLAEPLLTRSLKMQVVYANLPTLPSDASQEEISRARKAASFYPNARLDGVPDFVGENLLELYYTFLKQMRSCLEPGGMVLCALGGRRFWEPIERLFTECGYQAEILVFDLKPQEQAEDCLPSYAALENRGRRFHFFPFQEARRELDILGEEMGGKELLESNGLLNDFHIEGLRRIASYSLSATDALEASKRGIIIGHLVYIVMGTLKVGN